MTIRWTPDMATGLAEVDEQHRMLFEQIERLVQHAGQPDGQAVVGETMAFLDVYIVGHFALEEALIRACPYPGCDRHFEQHQQFRENFAWLRQRVAAAGSAFNAVMPIRQLVYNWLVQHIGMTDRVMARFLLAQQRPAAPGKES